MPAAPSTSVSGLHHLQPSLLGWHEPALGAGLGGLRREHLASGAWVDVATSVVDGADTLFEEVLAAAPWAGHERPMYDRVVPEPRLTTRRWAGAPALVHDLGSLLSEHYGVDLSTISANLYRSGSDSVAWHGDRIGRDRPQAVVAVLSLGATRRFLLRPRPGGPSRRYAPASGDLLVMGGTCQRTWQHSVPKCAVAGPRISVMFREGY